MPCPAMLVRFKSTPRLYTLRTLSPCEKLRPTHTHCPGSMSHALCPQACLTVRRFGFMADLNHLIYDTACLLKKGNKSWMRVKKVPVQILLCSTYVRCPCLIARLRQTSRLNRIGWINHTRKMKLSGKSLIVRPMKISNCVCIKKNQSRIDDSCTHFADCLEFFPAGFGMMR